MAEAKHTNQATMNNQTTWPRFLYKNKLFGDTRFLVRRLNLCPLTELLYVYLYIFAYYVA